MDDQAVSRIEVSIGDVDRSQLVVGDHNTIQTPEGTEVTVLQVGDRPVPRLRPMPVRRPDAVEIVGREEEATFIASSAGTAVQFYAEDGAGKSALLRFAAGQLPGPAEGVVFQAVRRRSLDEIQAELYATFWECDIPFIPDPAQVGDFLADREALLILDDCGLDRDDLETLLEDLPRCSVVLASEARTLWSRGAARRLGDLDPEAAVRLLERELGHTTLTPEERAAAEAIVAQLGGNPQVLIETAAVIEDGRSSLRELADDPAALERAADQSALTDSQWRILQVLSALDGATLGVERLSDLTGIPETERTLRQLERRGWVKAGSPRYRRLRRLPPGAVAHQSEMAQQLLGRLAAWSGKAGVRAIASEAEAIERTLELGVAAERWQESLALSLAAERGLFVAGAWASSRNVLQIGLRAAGMVDDESARAYLLHQLGSQSLCLGDPEEAADLLATALRIRDALGEREGAELTHHNLRQLGGGGGANGGGDRSGGGGPPQWVVVALAVLALVAAGIGGALALAGDDGGSAATTEPATADSPGPAPLVDDGDPEVSPGGTESVPAGTTDPGTTDPGTSEPRRTDSVTGEPSATEPGPTDEGSLDYGGVASEGQAPPGPK